MLRNLSKMLPSPETKFLTPCQTMSSIHSFGPLLPTATVTSLLPLPDHLRHALHGLPPLLETALERALPELTLDLLADTRALDSETVLDALLLLDLGVLGGARHQWQDIVLGGEFEEFCLSAQGVVWGVPVAGAWVLEGQERVAVARVCGLA